MPQFDHVKLKLNSDQIVAISHAIPLQLFYERAVYLLPTNQRSRQEIYGQMQSAHFRWVAVLRCVPAPKKEDIFEVKTTTAILIWVVKTLTIEWSHTLFSSSNASTRNI